MVDQGRAGQENERRRERQVIYTLHEYIRQYASAEHLDERAARQAVQFDTPPNEPISALQRLSVDAVALYARFRALDPFDKNLYAKTVDYMACRTHADKYAFIKENESAIMRALESYAALYLCPEQRGLSSGQYAGLLRDRIRLLLGELNRVMDVDARLFTAAATDGDFAAFARKVLDREKDEAIRSHAALILELLDRMPKDDRPGPDVVYDRDEPGHYKERTDGTWQTFPT